MVAPFLFFLLAIVAIAAAFGLIFSKNPMVSALWLVLNLFCIAGLYLTLHAQFIGVIQIIVYAGAIMVLFLFTIMLLNVRDADPQRQFRWLPWAVLGIAVLILGTIATTAFLEPRLLPGAEMIASALDGGSPDAIGQILFSDYVLAFQLVGVLLLTGVVGAVSLVQRRATDVSGGEA